MQGRNFRCRSIWLSRHSTESARRRPRRRALARSANLHKFRASAIKTLYVCTARASGESWTSTKTNILTPVTHVEVTTVARTVLIAYFEQLAATEGFAEIALKLRKAILEEGQFNEAAIKAALFADVA